MTKRKIIVMGASAGGVEPLIQIIKALPADFAASVFVVVHRHPQATNFLPELLSKYGQLPALSPAHKTPITCGNVYVAPPDHHMMVGPREIQIVRGPKEKYYRPAIDPLFHSAALHFNTEVIGVILSGLLHDGTAGLQSIKQAGGLAIVQDPREALYQSMPASALKNVAVDFVLPVNEIAAKLVELTGEESPEPATAKVYDAISEEMRHEQVV